MAITSDVFTFLLGGKAGDGTKKAGTMAARLFADEGRHVFLMDDYPSLIRGGHNFSVISTAIRPITSHHMQVDLLVCCDERTYNAHVNEVKKDGIIVYNSDVQKSGKGIGIPMSSEASKLKDKHMRIGAAAIGVLAAATGVSKEYMNQLIEAEYPRGVENNKLYIGAIYDMCLPKLKNKFTIERGKKKHGIITGNQAIALGAAAAGLDIYVGYPMTPSSSILTYLAKVGPKIGVTAVHAENEIGVINMGLGAAYAGVKAMVGSSGGGVALMEETLSLAGITEVPLLTALCSRPGPATGVPTYTSQDDLNFALNQGHGEFTTVVASPGTMEENFYLTAEMLDLVWQYQIPGILLTEKHMCESQKTVEIDVGKAAWPKPKLHKGKTQGYLRYKDTKDGISPMLFPPAKGAVIKANSYEHTEDGITTEDPKAVVKMIDKRNRKHDSLLKHMKKMKTVNTFGTGKNIIVTYGSTFMSVQEAVEVGNIKAQIVQPVYLKPFPVWEFDKLKGKDVIVVELSVRGQFAQLLEEKTGIKPKAVIKRYDGRPFEPNELGAQLQEVLK